MENIDYLCNLREFELYRALFSFPPPTQANRKCRVLEIGAGMGHQAKLLTQLGYDVVAIDIPLSAYRNQRVHPVVEFDGRRLPIASESVDVVFSSNVLEHILDIDGFLDETIRVTTPGGIAIHILPTPGWRLWTILGHYGWIAKKLASLSRGSDSNVKNNCMPQNEHLLGRFARVLFPTRHGERGMTLTEGFYFSHWWWKRKFEAHRWQVSTSYATGLFYTGGVVFGSYLSNPFREKMARWLGSACRIYILRRL